MNNKLYLENVKFLGVWAFHLQISVIKKYNQFKLFRLVQLTILKSLNSCKTCTRDISLSYFLLFKNY